MHQAVQAWSFRQQIISRGVSKAEDNHVLPSAHGFPWTLSVTWHRGWQVFSLYAGDEEG